MRLHSLCLGWRKAGVVGLPRYGVEALARPGFGITDWATRERVDDFRWDTSGRVKGMVCDLACSRFGRARRFGER